MNIIKAYGRGFKNSLRRPKMILLIYVISLILGLSLALPFFFSFQSASDSSILSKTLDYTTFSELTNFHAWNLDSIFRQAGFTMVVFWLLMIFFVGGIVRTFNKEDYSVSTFFSGAGVNFFRFLLCDIIMIVAQIVTAVILFALASFLLVLFGNIVSETPLLWAYGIAGFVFLCAVVLLLMISDYAKFYMEMAETHRVFKAIWQATKYVFNNFLKTYFLYALLLVLPILTLVLYKFTFDKIGTAATWALIVMFLVQQLFVILRIWFRIWSLSSQFEMYADDYVQTITYDIELVETSDGNDVESTENESDNNDVDSKSSVSANDVDKIIVIPDSSDSESITETSSDSENITETSSDSENITEDSSDPQETVVKTVTQTVEDPETETVTTTTTTTTTETFVLNDEGDTFTKVSETSDNENVSEEVTKTDSIADIEPDNQQQTTNVINEQGDTFTTTETVEQNDSQSTESAEPDDIDVETLTEFYDQQDESDYSAEAPEDAVEKSSDSVVTETTSTTTTETTTTVETTTETSVEDLISNNLNLSKSEEKSEEPASEKSSETNLKIVQDSESDDEKLDFSNSEIKVFDQNESEGSVTDSATEEVSDSDSTDEELPGFNPDDLDGNDEALDADTSETQIVESDNVPVKTIDGETIQQTSEEEVSDTEMLQNEEFADNLSEESSDNLLEFGDADSDIDTAMGANISLDEEEEDIVSTVTNSDSESSNSESESSESKSDPKIIKIYTESDSPTDETEIVPEYIEDGVVSGEQRSEEQFVKEKLTDNGSDDSNSPALG